MRLSHRDDRWKSERAPSELLERIHRLAREQVEPRARLEVERQLRIPAAQVAPIIGEAVERFAQAMRAPLPHGRAGGLARARSAWRYFDGTFMPESEMTFAFLADYERYAAGGRARAATARRASDGTFLAQS